MNFLLIESKILTGSDKVSWFNQLSESEAACASSLDVSAVSKKKKIKIMGAKKAEEQARSILHPRILHFSK